MQNAAQVSVMTAGVLTLQGLIVFATAWAVLLALVWASPLPSAFKQQHADRIPSTLHALTASAGSLLAWLNVDSDCSIADFRTHWVRLALLSTSGFLCVDVCSMFVVDVWQRWRKVDLAVFFHHALVIFCLLVSCETNAGMWFQVSLLINELAVVPLNMVQMLRFYGLQHLAVYRLMMVCTGILWLLCRIVAIPLSLWRLRSRQFCSEEWGPGISFAAVAAYLVLWSMNVFWLGKLAQGALKPRASAPACGPKGPVPPNQGAQDGSLERHFAAVDSEPETDVDTKAAGWGRGGART